MRTRSFRGALLAMVVAAAVAAGPAAWARDETFPFRADKARLAADPHTVVVSGTYSCGPLDLDVVGGGGSVELTVSQGQVQGFGYAPVEVCDGSAKAFQGEVTTFGQPVFKRGGATLIAGGQIRGQRDGQDVTLVPTPRRQRITITRG
jgi:hypothetical protein